MAWATVHFKPLFLPRQVRTASVCRRLAEKVRASVVRQIQQSAGGTTRFPISAGTDRQLSNPVCPEALPPDIHPSDCLLPATGYRNTSTGALSNVGANGNYWSSSSYAAGNLNVGGLHCRADNVNPLNGHNRANGLSVRCVQHLRAVFIKVKSRK